MFGGRHGTTDNILYLDGHVAGYANSFPKLNLIISSPTTSNETTLGPPYRYGY